MAITAAPIAAPVTRLRPLHSRQHASGGNAGNALNAGSVQTSISEADQHVHWSSSIHPAPTADAAIQSFVRLVSLILVLDPGDAYCIQDVARGGFLLAHSPEKSTENREIGVEFIKSDCSEIQTDFSIGDGKTLQLHIDASTGQVQLVAQVAAIPEPALNAIGVLFDDILSGRDLNGDWKLPSVLNLPPESRPVELLRNSTVDGPEQPALLHRWFEQCVLDHPERHALDFLLDLETGERIQYTYGQVENAANAVAQHLVSIGKTDPVSSSTDVKTVAVLIGPSPELYISYLAILKAGMAFCPIPLDAPEERIAALVDDLSPVAVLVSSAKPAQPPSVPAGLPTVDATAFLDNCNNSCQRPSIEGTDSDVAYIIYTSGTTGKPKGVCVSHISAACTVSSLSKHYGFTSSTTSSSTPTRWFQGAAPTFDISLFEIFWTLSTGSTLCCAPRELTLQDINKVVTTLEADITNITPSFASLLDPASIPGVMVGGETVNARLLQTFSPQNGKTEGGQPRGIYNGYGPTETAIYCIAQAHVPENQRGSVIGTPIGTCGVVIVDALDGISDPKPVPMGAVGELVITGPQVSRVGYRGRPEETGRAFFDHASWGRSYRTGDRARVVWDAQGGPLVEFLGRISDGQVKLSGRRVELAEIESVLASRVPDIQDVLCCVWKPRGSTLGSERVVGLVVARPQAGSDFVTVRQQCMDAAQTHLPDYMRPFRILQTKEMPRSASGKTNRAAASAYVAAALENVDAVSQSTAGPATPLPNADDAALEDAIAAVVSRALGDADHDARPGISATASLVDAGMDSLRAMRLLRDLRVQFPDHPRASSLQPPLARLLDPRASIRSTFFPETGDGADSVLVQLREERAKRQLAAFSSRFAPHAVDKLGLSSPDDVAMVLPATATQAQLATSFAIDRRNYISHTVLRLAPGTSMVALGSAVRDVVLAQPIYRSAILPCDDPLSPFAQVTLTKTAWLRFTEQRPRVAQRAAAELQDTKPFLDRAEQALSLDNHVLYHIQLIEAESGSSPSSHGLLVISAAHCICDGASLEVLLSDIARQYAGVDPLPRHGVYEAVLDWAAGVDAETDQTWRDLLEGWESDAFGALSGNNVRTPPAEAGHGMVQCASSLSWQALEAKSRRLGATPLSVVQTAWSLLLHLLSEADTAGVVFGSVVSGSHWPAHAPTFSVVPCRVDMAETQTVRAMLDALARSSRLAVSRRHMSFGNFKALPYHAALALQAYATDADSGDVAAPWATVENPAIRYDFALFAEVLVTARCLAFKLTFRDDVLSETAATCLVQQLAALVEAVLAASPDDLVQALPARLPRHLLSVEGVVPPRLSAEAADERKASRRDLLHQQFEEQARATPDRLALSFYRSLDAPPAELSYGALDARANGLARVLRQENVEVIPICMQRSVELYVSILAILKAGSAWCPIDETSPVQRRTSLIARTESKIMLTTTASLPLVEACLAHASLAGMRLILVDQYAAETATATPRPREAVEARGGLAGDGLAYLLWTSGTTGEPKGVMIQHRAAAQAMRDLQVQVAHDPAAGQVRTLQLSAYSFDVFVQDLFYTWGLAGSVVSGTRELVLGSFVDLIWTARPTHAHLTPSFGASIHVDDIRGSALQFVTFIGEKLTEDVAEAWAAPGITTMAYNTYGPAENAVVSTLRQFHGRSRDAAKAANVGFPLHHCTAYVLREVATPGGEKRWELVPRYGVGELAHGGAQVAQGYLNNADKTARAFVEGVAGIDERIYLTGDTVRLNDHGFEFLGRNDDLVKITGIRIELSEISAACASVKSDEPAVEHVETLHLPRPGSASSKVVVTFVSVRARDADPARIRTRIFQRARAMLPAYMVPGHVVVLATTMPRTASNKVDRKALQAVYAAADLGALAGTDDAAPGSRAAQWTDQQRPILRTVAGIFQTAEAALAPGDSLAGLGFSSLEVTKLAWSLRRELDCPVRVLDLMRCQFLGELVDAVLAALPGDDHDLAAASRVDIALAQEAPQPSWVAAIGRLLMEKLHGSMRPSSTASILPATPLQESLIVETMRDPGAYWAHRVFDTSQLGQIDERRLQAAWASTAAKFDILRTAFVPLTGLRLDGHANVVAWAREQGVHSTILQIVRGGAPLRWTALASSSGEALSEQARKLQTELAPTTATLPPWAVTFCQDSGKLMLSMHHALYDGVASEIMLDTVVQLYRDGDRTPDCAAMQFGSGLALGLLPTASQREDAAAKWNTRLAVLQKTTGALNAPFPDLTQSRQKQPQAILLSRRAISTPPAVCESGSSRVPPLPTLFQSAFGCILAAYLELKAVMIGQTVSQRLLHPDLARVVGPAVATLPLVVRADGLSADALWRDMARDATDFFHASHCLHPVDIKRMLNKDSESADAPFPGLFVYHPAPAGDGHRSSPAAAFRETGQALSLNVEHPLALNVFEGDGTMELTGDGRRISQAQLDFMLDQIVAQAQAMAAFPRAPLGQLANHMEPGFLSISRAGALADDAIPSNPADAVAAHAARHPDWVAVDELRFGEADGDDDDDDIHTTPVTYKTLDTLCNAIVAMLAHHAARLVPDDIVAVYLARDALSLAATLAVFRAGYVYLPIDEELPLERKKLLLHDAQARLVVTTEAMAADLGLDVHRDPSVLLLPDDGALDIVASPKPDDTHHSLPATSVAAHHHAGGYLLYTSGSTGKPKGVRVSNANLCHFIAAFSDRLLAHAPATAGLGGAGKYLNLTSRAFDPHLTQLFVPWHLGYRVVIGRDRTAMLGSLPHIVRRLGITHFGSVPSVLAQLRLRPADVPSVRVVTTGGEKASAELLDTWSAPTAAAATTGPVLFNFYGPTEVTIGCLGHAVGPASNARCLGLPLRGLEALLLCPGPEQVVARRGQPGELCMAGPQVAMGYLDRPAENAASFQTTALLGGSRRIYRTGDMMRMMHDGTLEFLGRKDQQAKIRGQRLELDEVVAFLRHAAADEENLDFAAAVVAHGTAGAAPQQQHLFAFAARKPAILLQAEAAADTELVPGPGPALAALLQRLETKCASGLPAFMVPTLLWVSKIPYLAASGKVDTKLLAGVARDFFHAQGAPHSRPQQVHQHDTAPLDPQQAIVVEALGDILGHEVAATPTSSLHRLGLDSLSAVHLLSLLRTRGFSRLGMSDILASECSVGSIARKADATTGKPLPAAAQHVVPDTVLPSRQYSLSDIGPAGAHLSGLAIEAVLPVLPLQSALVAQSLVWLGSSDDGDATVPYVAQFDYRLSPGTDLARWRRAVEQTVAAEAMLRTCFVQRDEDGQIFQVVLEAPALSPFAGPVDARSVVAQMHARPPIRVHVPQPGSAEADVSLRIHHTLFDGVAIDALRKRVEHMYDKEMADVESAASASLALFRSVSTLCSVADAESDSARRWWQARLQGVPPCRVGSGHASAGAMARATSTLRCTAFQLKAKLSSIAANADRPASSSSVFQMATSLCLAHLTGQSTVVYGLVLSLRPLLSHAVDGVDGFLGPCLNTLVQTASVHDGRETLAHLVQRVAKDLNESCQGKTPLVSTEQVQRWAASEDRLFDSVLNINAVPGSTHAGRDTLPGRMHMLQTQSKSSVALAIDVDIQPSGQIDLMLSSSGALSQSRLQQIAQLFDSILDSFVGGDGKVEHFFSSPAISRISEATSDSASPDTPASSKGFQEALSSVVTTLATLLRLDLGQIPDAEIQQRSLYQLGLDSINVLPFVRRLSKAQQVRLTPDAVIKAKTVRGVALLLQRTSLDSKSKHGVEKPHSTSRNCADDAYNATLGRLAQDFLFVATPLQEGMLSASLAIADEAYTYVHTVQLSEHALRVDGPGFDTFFAAIRDTVQACEILRTRFVFTQNEDAPWIGIVSPTEQSDRVRWDAARSGPPGRMQLRIHHALYDAASMQTVWRVLGAKYRARLHGGAHNDADDEHYAFRTFAKAVAVAQTSSVPRLVAAVRDYTYEPLDFPADSLQASSAAQFSFSEHDLGLLQARCQSVGVTLKAALQLAWAKVLCESLYGQADVVFGEVVSAGSGFEGVVGPMINTVPMRVQLASGSAMATFREALQRVQGRIDDMRGPASMASLRDVQTQWRSSSVGHQDTPASLFQSLFVFDGISTTERPENGDGPEPLFRSVESPAGQANAGPAFDDYPLIISFHVHDNALHGKLRAKLGDGDVKSLASELQAALQQIASLDLSQPAISLKGPKPVTKKNAKRPHLNGASRAENKVNGTPKTATIVDIVHQVLGSRSKDVTIRPDAKLINIGLDSILAIRLSKLLKKRLGIDMGVFEIIKGATVNDIATAAASRQQVVEPKPRQPSLVPDDKTKAEIASKLGLSPNAIQTVAPLLPGQRAHLTQWLHNGKRFFEAPWVYRVLDDTLDGERVARCWAELCRLHDVLRTTFVWSEASGLVQATLTRSNTGQGQFFHVRGASERIQSMVEEHIHDGNGKPSDLRVPPARLSFLEASDGKAIVLRLHHALYDAWSIKMIERDLADLLTAGSVRQPREPLSDVIEKINNIRSPDAESAFWKQHLSHAQETVLDLHADSSTGPAGAASPLGPHFKISQAVWEDHRSLPDTGTARLSSAVILAYAKSLGRFTNTAQPTFGLNHSSRSLSSAEGSQTLDLTAASVPTMTITPLSVDLGKSNDALLSAIQDYLAQLAKFAQSDNLQHATPRYNTYLNILFPDDHARNGAESATETGVIRRQRLDEPLASSYFTEAKPSSFTASTIDGLDTSALSPRQFFFNIIVRKDLGITASASGNGCSGSADEARRFTTHFAAELKEALRVA